MYAIWIVLEITFEEKGGRKETRIFKKNPFQNIFFLLSIEKAHYNPFFFQVIS